MAKSTSRSPKKAGKKQGSGGPNVRIGKVNATNFAARDIKIHQQSIDSRKQVAQFAVPPEFLTSARELQKELSGWREDPALPAERVKEVKAIEGKVQEAVEAAHKPQPQPGRIQKALGEAADLAGKVAEKVGPFAELALKLATLAEMVRRFNGA